MKLDPTTEEIQDELGKVVLLFQSNIKGKKKLDSFYHLEESRDGALSGERDLDSHSIAKGSAKLVVHTSSLHSISTSTFTEDTHSGDVTGNLCRESNAPEAHSNRAATPPPIVIYGCPMDVDTDVDKVSMTYPDVDFEDGSHSSSSNPILAEQMYRFVNRQRHDSNIKILQSSYQALLCDKVISYSGHSQFSSITACLKPTQTIKDSLKVETSDLTTPASIHEPTVCSTGTPNFGTDTSEVVDDNVYMLMECASIPSNIASPLIKLPLDGNPTFQCTGTKRSNTGRENHMTVALCCRRTSTRGPLIKRQGKRGTQSNFVCLCRVYAKAKRGYGTQSG